MTFAEILDKHGLTQTDASRKTGIPLRTIQDWKAEKRKPPEWVLKLVDFYLSAQ